MHSVASSIEVYARQLRVAGPELPKILAMPLVTLDDADQFMGACAELEIGIGLEQLYMAAPTMSQWEVLNWLQNPFR